jgi:hypothetical protein
MIITFRSISIPSAVDNVVKVSADLPNILWHASWKAGILEPEGIVLCYVTFQ